MVILLWGSNSYSRSKKLREIVNDKTKDANILLAKFDFEEEDGYLKFRDFVSESSIFSPKKIAIIDNAFETKQKKELKKMLQDSAQDKETLVMIVSDTKPPASFSFLLDKGDKFINNQNFPDFKKGEELNKFILKEAAARSLDLSKEEVVSIGDVFGSDIWAIATELDKLSLVNTRDIPSAASGDYFKTINGFKGGKSVKDKILNLEILLSDRGDEPAKIFNMLGFGFATKELIDTLADYDVMIKSGKMDYEEALLDLALKN